MADKDKLIWLLETTEICNIGGRKQFAKDLYLPHVFEKFADQLIKNGVGFVRKDDDNG